VNAERLIVWTQEPLNAETPLRSLCRSFVTPTERFFVRNHGPVPAVDEDEYRLALAGEVHEPLVLSLRELRERFARATVTATLACAGNRRSDLNPVPDGIPWGAGAVGNAVWTGIRLGDLLRAAGIGADARHVAFTGVDRADAGGRREPFAGSIPLEKALADEVLLAYEMNGEPLEPEHGFPLRAVVPGYVGARSVKWLSEISVRSSPSSSFFQTTDYTLDGSPLGEGALNSAICDGGLVRGGRSRVEGYAVSGAGRPLDRVEVSGDGGRSWRPASLRETGEPWSWRLWHAEVDVRPDSPELVVRAWESSGEGQPEAPPTVRNPRGYMNNAWHRMRLTF
jgi:sulfite oxidase